MKFVNLTHHLIVLKRPNGAKQRIPPSGVTIRARTRRKVIEYLDGMPIVEYEYSLLTSEEPPKLPGTYYIVSAHAAHALRHRGDVLIPADRYVESGKVKHCRALLRLQGDSHDKDIH